MRDRPIDDDWQEVNEFHEDEAPRERPRFKWRLKLFALIVLAALSPAIYSYIKCPYMPYYKDHFPKRTAFMERRIEQAKEKGEKYSVRYKPVPLGQISKNMRRAVVMAEDARFYEHNGIDIEAIEEAYRINQKRGKVVRGGSTISQQVAKNLWLSPERSLWRKLIEAILTWRMERALSKDRILELYLNTIEWGRGIFGVAAASEAYFSTTPANLSATQAATLAAVIRRRSRRIPTRPP